ncbi:unnamed protein product [Brassicogethes aeneus]|uniref:Uncharacterized protein n=1 Tax=Brassicogethes aeneus TaxID=1431903 RepID=A0A9P0B028_BRAAE|nr:unnamed protein product [Brassicogethes aeneus]
MRLEICSIFALDQRTLRNMRIGTIDPKISQLLTKKQARQVKDKTSLQQPSTSTSKRETNVSSIHISYICNDESETMENVVKPSDLHNNHAISTEPSADSDRMDRKYKLQMRLDFKSLPSVCDRYGVSDRAAAAIASAVLEDVGLIKKGDTSKVVDKNKVRRSRQKIRTELQANDDFQNKPLKGLYFDGRKDNTLRQEKVGNKYYRKTVKEEHLSLLQEPESVYIGHIVPASGTAINLCDAIRVFLETKQIDQKELLVIRCDGTIVNTGMKGGVIRLLEEALKRPFHWFVCQLHSNELPLRHLLQDLDGQTTGPHSHKGLTMLWRV